jgi:TonB family protein
MRTFTFLIFLASAATSFAQTKIIQEQNADIIYNTANVQVKPQFLGGDLALQSYLVSSINYPAKAKDNGIQGKVVVKFTISKTGNVKDVEIIRGIGGGCDQEAIRVVKNMPNWVPGSNNGVPVTITYTLPVSFNLSDNNTIFFEEHVDEKAVFAAGEDAMNKHLSSNIKYPPTAKDNGIQGTVTVKFMVDKNGQASRFSVVKSLSPECDEAALNCLQSLPNTWIPAKLKGYPVNSYKMLPIKFGFVE